MAGAPARSRGPRPQPVGWAAKLSEHIATVEWCREGAAFTDQRYPRAHRWSFDGGAVVHASASPAVVPEPLSDPTAVDPEEAFVAALSSCHMLWFLSLAAGKGWVVESYRDEAVGRMGRGADGRLAITTVDLRPAVAFAARDAPAPAEVAAAHHEAHERCFLASSVKSLVRCTPVELD